MTLTQTDMVSTTLVATSSGRVNAFAIPTLRSVALTSTAQTFYDSDITENDNAETWNEYRVETLLGSDYTVQNLSASQTLTDGVVAPVGAGGIGRVCVSDGAVSKIIKCDTTKRGGQTFREFVEYTAGTVARYLYDQIASLFDATPDVDYFSTYDHATSTYTRNAACWGASINLSCVAVASNSGSGWTRQRGGTLITPRHLLIARHFAYGIDTQVRFSNAAGTIETQTVIGTSADSVAGDLLICTLSAAVTIASPCAVAGDWIMQDFGDVANSANVVSWYSGGVIIYFNQAAELYVATLGSTVDKISALKASVTINGSAFPYFLDRGLCDHTQGGIPSEFVAMRSTPVPGDSGQPAFAVIEGNPVLLWCWLAANIGPPVYQSNGAVLNALIAVSDANAGISTGYTVTVAPDPTL